MRWRGAFMRLRCEGCCKMYMQGESKIVAVHPATFEFRPGINMIIGKSGSGKTTFLNMLAGLEIPTYGEVYFGDKNLYDVNTKLAAIRRKQFGFIFQSYNLIPELTVKDNILLPLYLLGQDNPKNDYQHTIKELGMSRKANQRPYTLSGGEQQKVAIARAIIHRPSIIFADEPTGNLDDENSEKVINILANMTNKYRLTLLLVTHDKELLKYADVIYNMRDGRLDEVKNTWNFL